MEKLWTRTQSFGYDSLVRGPMNSSRTTAAFIVVLLSALCCYAQSNPRDAAIRHYVEGRNPEAIESLKGLIKQAKYSNDAELIEYLGLAYLKTPDNKDARKMLEKAVKLEPSNATYRANLAYGFLLERKIGRSRKEAEKAIELDPANMPAYYVLRRAELWEWETGDAMRTADKMIALDPGFPPGYMLKSDTLVAILGKKVAAGSSVKDEIGLLANSVAVLEDGLKHMKQEAYKKSIEEMLESARAFHEYYSREPASNGARSVPEPGVTPIKILSKPRASYTDKARNANRQGSIMVAVLLGANGRVLHVMVLRGLGYGLDEQAVAAASRIVFEPKKKNGIPVSTVIKFEYTFSIY